MRILLSIKAVLNYLYNHLIDLVWTKKIRFADGTEMTTVPTGNNLYDIKLLSQAVADKGFAFMCHTTRRNLPKADVPTLYNDILRKYNSAETEDNPTTNLYNTTATNLYYKDGYYYFNYDGWNVKEIRRSANSDLSASELCFSLPDEVYAWDWTFIITDIGFWICASCDNDQKKLFIYDFDYNLIQTINLTEDDNGGYYIFKKFEDYVYLSIGRHFYRFRDVINTTKQVMPRYLNTEDPYNPYYEITYNMNIIDDKIICCCLVGEDTYFRHFFVLDKNTLAKQQLSFHDTDGYWDWHTSPVSNIFKFNGNYYFTANRYGLKICKINIETGYISEEYMPKVNGVYMDYDDNGSLCEVVGDTVIIQSSHHILTSTDLINFTEVYNLTGDGYNKCANWYLTSDTMIFFFLKGIYKTMYLTDDCYLYIGLVKKEFTDTYNINGTTVNIKYYKYQDFKICLADGGTNDTNLETVFNYLGYLNYWLIDLTNETVCIQRDKNTYSAMFIGDDFIDDLNDLPTNDYSCVALKKYVDTLISQVGAVGITPYAISSLSTGTKNTVYGKTTKPTLIIFGELPPNWEDDWNFYLKVSTDNNTWIDVAYWRVGSGDPSSSPMYNAVIGAGLYWKFTTSHGSYTLKYAPLY